MKLEPQDGEQPLRFQWEQALRSARALTTAERCVALMMATWGNLDGTSITVSAETVARASGLKTDRAVRAIWRRLQGFGWLRSTPRIGATNVFELILPRGYAPERGSTDEHTAEGVSRGTHRATPSGGGREGERFDERPSPFAKGPKRR
jgi:hypothetical protein